jgi:hypothetical protein
MGMLEPILNILIHTKVSNITELTAPEQVTEHVNEWKVNDGATSHIHG